MAEEKKTINLTIPIIFILAVIVAFLAGSYWTRAKSSEQESGRAGEQEKKVAQASPSPAEEGAVLGELATTIGDFLVTKDEVCLKGDRPVVYFFGSESCPHCTWEHPIVKRVTAKFDDQIVFHDNMDQPGVDQEIWEQYREINRGAVPFLVLGCRYVRVGSGERAGEEAEEQSLTALICKLTDGQPESVCRQVEDLIEQVAE